MRDGISRGDTCIVATDGKTTIGSTVFSICNGKKGKFAEWHAFYLLPQYVGKGVGHLFYQEIEKEMVRQGCQSCTLEVLSSNERAVHFYLSHGFEKIRMFTVEENGMILSCDEMIKNLQNISPKQTDVD